MGWGTEANQCLRVSRPPELINDLIARHGLHPLFEDASSKQVSGADDKETVLSYRIPNAYDVPALFDLADRLRTGARRRAQIIGDLLGRGPWDFLLGVFAETHTAGHLLWHLSREHPLKNLLTTPRADDPMLRVFQAVDEGVGEVLAHVPKDAYLVIFSTYGLFANVLDLPSMVFLPELLYRWNFPGETGLGSGGHGGRPPPPRTNYRAYWAEEVWNLRAQRTHQRLESPAEQERRGDPLYWQPANWYRPLWPDMKAFALPTYSEGLIRINVKGRDAAGQVDGDEFGQTCDALCEYLSGVTDARSGRPMVREIMRARRDPFDKDERGPAADLIVLWQEDEPTDVVEAPGAGRIGPMPYFRSGGHSSKGFVLARGPGIEPGSRLPETHAEDLTATFFNLVGQSPPKHVCGRPVIRSS